MGSQYIFIGEFPAGGGDHTAIGLAIRGNRNLREIALAHKGVLVIVQVDILISVKVDRIGTCGPGAVVKVGIKDLRGERLPAAGRSAEGSARPALADVAILL